MLKAVIVEDELMTRDAIVNIINNYCADIKVAGVAGELDSALEVISNIKPDILVLDVMLSNCTAFDLLKLVRSISFQIIFITAYEGYALKAIKFSAFDYILKPFSRDELVTVFSRVKDKILKDKSGSSFETLLQHIENKEDKKIVLKTLDEMHIVKVDDIIFCEADSSYTHFKIKDSSSRLTVSGNLKGFEELLSSHMFFRVHHSYLVNINQIIKYCRVGAAYVLMTDGSEIPVSTRKREQLTRMLNTL